MRPRVPARNLPDLRWPWLCCNTAAHPLWRNAEPAACSHCGGRGTIIRNPCKTCRGTGKTAARKSLEINIPAGIDDDQNIALRGQGDAGSNGGPAGDVIVHVTVKADPMFERDGYDVTIHVPITFSQAVLGDDVEVPTVDGRIVQHIPEGTQSGTKFRLRGQGIQYLNAAAAATSM